MALINLPLEMSMFLVLTTIVELNRRGKRRELQQILRATASLAALPALSAIALLLLAGPLLFSLYFGPEYRGAAAIFAVLALGQFTAIWSGNAGYVLVMTGHQNLTLLVNLVSATVLFAGGFLAATRYGVSGLAAASAGAVAIQNLGQWPRPPGLRSLDARRRRPGAKAVRPRTFRKGIGAASLWLHNQSIDSS